MIRKPPWFTVHERNRVRRNLEIFNPQTLHKAGAYDVWDLFKQVTGYQNPKPWNIQKDFKVFNWRSIEDMMKEIMKKYTVVVGEDEVLVPGEEGEEVDDIEDELVQANRDLMEEFARIQEQKGDQKHVRYDSSSTFNIDWLSGERLPGHACFVEETGGEGQHDMVDIGRWHTFDEGEMGLGNTQSFDTSQAWDTSQSQTSHFDGFLMNPHAPFTNGFGSTLGLSEGSFEEINPALQNYYEQSQSMSQGWPLDLDVPHLGMHDSGGSGILGQLNLEEETPISNEPEETTSSLKNRDEERLSMADMIVGSPPEQSTGD